MTETLPLVRRALTSNRVERGSGILRPLKYLENCEYFCYLEDALQTRIQVGKFDPAADLRSRAMQTHDDAEAAAIDVADFAEIEHDLLGFGQVIPDEMTQISRLFAKYKPAATLNDKNPSKRARDHLKRHEEPLQEPHVADFQNDWPEEPLRKTDHNRLRSVPEKDLDAMPVTESGD
jgi:hypothetical protein